MLRVKSITLENIKTFTGLTTVSFDDSKPINTVSGINGSGKSTVFKSLVIAQKLFFFNQIKHNDALREKISEELLSYFNGEGSKITVTLVIIEREIIQEVSYSVHCTKRTNEGIEWRIHPGTNEAVSIIEKYWNLKAPKYLIIYIDSNKFSNEADFSSSEISISRSKSVEELAAEYIFRPEQLFQSTYERLMIDYARERIIPSKQRRDLPHVVAKILISRLLPYLEILNFTGSVRDRQFILLVKRKGRRKKDAYDMRYLSSGEKTIFYTLHFVCYMKSLSMLIIDEPENNLHENLLSDYVRLLNEMCVAVNFGDYVRGQAKIMKRPLPALMAKNIDKLYQTFDLQRVFMLTHSKTLAYNVFGFGKNYYMHDRMLPIDNDETERVFREIGLSKVYEKVLFVEGITELGFIEKVMAPYNVKVRALGGCSQVISAYRHYSGYRQYIKDAAFCFMIDRDTRDDADIELLRSQDPVSFDSTFIVMNRHEFENYFIDETIWLEVHRRYISFTSLFPVDSITQEDIQRDLRTLADETKDKVLRQTLAYYNGQSLSDLQAEITSNHMPIDQTAYMSYIAERFENSKLATTMSRVKSNYRKAKEQISDWDSNWETLCDGKYVLDKYINKVASRYNAKDDQVTSVLFEVARSMKESDAGMLLTMVHNKLKTLSS